MSGDKSLVIRIDQNDMIDKICLMLGDLRKKTPNVLQNAVNNTATYARSRIVEAAKARYALRKDKKKLLNKDQMKIIRADKRKNNYTASLRAKTMLTNLSYFDIKPKPRGGPVYARVLADSAMKLMYSQSRKPNPFVSLFDSGHTAVVKREIGTEYQTHMPGSKKPDKRGARVAKGWDTTALAEYMGPAAASMFKMAYIKTPDLIDDVSDAFGLKVKEQIAKVVNAEAKRMARKAQGGSK